MQTVISVCSHLFTWWRSTVQLPPQGICPASRVAMGRTENVLTLLKSTGRQACSGTQKLPFKSEHKEQLRWTSAGCLQRAGSSSPASIWLHHAQLHPLNSLAACTEMYRSTCLYWGFFVFCFLEEQHISVTKSSFTLCRCSGCFTTEQLHKLD